MEAKVIRTAKNTGDRFTEKQSLHLKEEFNNNIPVLAINPEVTFQEHMGFGGAFTEAAAYTLSEMSEEKRAEAIKKYFDPKEGLGYTLGRVHIHSCDFALGNYTYIEEGDTELSTYDMSHEDKWVVPMVNDATKVAGQELTILASPWSPPAFMKSNKEMNYGGYLLPEFRQAWANYYVKFIEGMKDRGIDIWGVSVQNEPAAIQKWDSCIYTSKDERDFVRDHLGPTFEKAGMAEKAIVIWDHNRDEIVERASTVLRDEEAAKYVWGTGNHWYVSEEFENLSVIHDLFPDKHILFTEGCQEGGPKPGEWFTGERYGRNIIGDFNNWSRGWLDWNLVLNEEGGPNHVGNLCDAPILADRQKDELIINSSYYYIGHFSKFIRPGAKRIQHSMNLPENVYATAFQNTDGSIAVVVQNERDHLQEFSLVHDKKGAEVVVPEHSITTFIL
ncbi:glycoside hydrolase family 30 protein [Chengkuizengella axinellae]|uniref:Glycoside hydrolase family 30 protein n=1 Tax=Chengkuizengella axinellae TaxID=3064388 RepID=A0ABT9IWY4_9BACL|nr:glycoside hydrolase family 30 protein [Chengkuizengella sp. 2205SS18-9]MDP5273880.1 glycoside hydrolase family 30 protein [Chengkuizengella sp. 2205SS18-9]